MDSSENNQEPEFSFNPDNVTEAKRTHHGSETKSGEHSHHSQSHGSHNHRSHGHRKKKKRAGLAEVIGRYRPAEKQRVGKDGKKKKTSAKRKALLFVGVALVIALVVLAILFFGQRLFHKHNFGEWTMKIEPTCTEVGYEIAVCKTCGAEQSREVPPSHRYVKESYDETTGVFTYVCEVCGDVQITAAEQ